MGAKPNFRKTAQKCVTLLASSPSPQLSASYKREARSLFRLLDILLRLCKTQSIPLPSLPHLSRSSAILAAAETARKLFFLCLFAEEASWDSGPQTFFIIIVWYFSAIFLAGRHIDSKLEFGPCEIPQLNPLKRNHYCS